MGLMIPGLELRYNQQEYLNLLCLDATRAVIQHVSLKIPDMNKNTAFLQSFTFFSYRVKKITIINSRILFFAACSGVENLLFLLLMKSLYDGLPSGNS